MRTVKCIAVGDGAVGKTCLLMRYALDKFPTEHCMTVFDHFQTNVMIDNQPISLNLWDTAGQEAHDELRPLSYTLTDFIIICYSVVDLSSMANVKNKWYPEVRRLCPSVPIILVGTKTDLRKERSPTSSTYTQGLALKKEIGARHFVETSAKESQGVDQVFEEAIRMILYPPKMENSSGCWSKCQLL